MYASLNALVGSLEWETLSISRGSTRTSSRRVDSMQIEHQNINQAEKGKVVGVKVKVKVREHDQVFRV